MGRRLGACCLALVAAGFAPRRGPRIAADTLTALPAAGVTKPLRLAARQTFGKSPPAWKRFVAAAGGSWQASWDAATGVPSRIWGSGIAAPGAIADPAVAERVARQVLADHIALLAPGAAASDFVLVSNVYDGDIRAVGFVQTAGNRRVVGGQVSFRFKRDRLFVIGSEALPNVVAPITRARLADTALQSRATDALRAAVVLPAAPVRALGDDVVLPLVADGGVLGYRVVAPFEIDGAAQGRYLAYADPATGSILAVHQLNEFATGTVNYHGVVRYPGRGYVDRPAPRAHVMVDSAAQTTTQVGGISWSPDQTVPLGTAADGDLVTVVNMDTVCSNDATVHCTGDSDCNGKCMNTVCSNDATIQCGTDADCTGNTCIFPNASAQMSIAPSGEVSWDASATPEDDAQIQAYLDTNIAKEYVRANVDAQMMTLDDQMTVNVNIDQTCNAYFDGTALNFFASGPASGSGACSPQNVCCENTARIQDVNFHEYGHRVHTAEIIPGVGSFDGAMSEGAADFLAVDITGDSGMGRGFFYTDEALRELEANPQGGEWMWPLDISSDIHHTGLVFGGTFWDLRKALIAQYGETAGIALTNKLYVAALRRAVDIPSCLIEVLAADDDDGNLANGTPDECLIRNTFGAHGLRTATGTIEAPGAIDQTTLAIGVAIQMIGLSSCTGDTLASATLHWLPGFNFPPGSQDAAPSGPGRWVAQLPLVPEGVTRYHAVVVFADGSTMMLADNRADEDYQTWSGPTVKLYCTDFEDGDPFAAGWTAGVSTGSPTWAWVVPPGGATNPPAAYSGTHAIEQVPGGDYQPSQDTWLKMPEINTWPYSEVHLQYRRWLAVEDSHFDQARVTASGKQAWMNATDNLGDASAKHHVDKEWRFHDVLLSGYYSGHSVVVGWDLKSDPGVEMAGWAIDDVCIVANPNAICGDGVRNTYEQCDNGSANSDTADACRTDCTLPRCGDGIVDSSEQCDDGPSGSKRCTTSCTFVPPSGGCCDSGGAGGGAAVLGFAVVLVLRRRR